MVKKIVSFGFRHYGGGPNQTAGVLVIDVRKMFKNPHSNPELRPLTGLHPEVQKVVMETPNFDALFQHLKERVTAPGIEIAYIGCTGGHHRSVFLAEKLAKELNVPVQHRDIDKP